MRRQDRAQRILFGLAAPILVLLSSSYCLAIPNTCGAPGGDLSFSQKIALNSGLRYRQLQAVSVDGAGDAHSLPLNLDKNPNPDLIAINASASGNQIVMHLNPSLTVAGITQTLTLGTSSLVGLKAADLDNDGKVDLLAASQSQVFVAWNSGDAVFDSIQTIATSGSFLIQGLSVGDYNSDGKLDISVSTDSLGIGSKRNLGGRVFETAWKTFLPLFSMPGTQIISFFANSDSRIDAARSLIPDGFFNDSGLEVFRSTSAQGGSISFASGASDHYLNVIEPAQLLSADFNNDAKDDIALVQSSSTSFSILRNTGASFLAPTVIPSGTAATKHAMVAGDLNRDGVVDVVLSNYQSNNVSALRNTGSGAFGSVAILPVGASPKDVVLIDIDHDGDQDIVMAHDLSGPAGLSILENKLCARATLQRAL